MARATGGDTDGYSDRDANRNGHANTDGDKHAVTVGAVAAARPTEYHFTLPITTEAVLKQYVEAAYGVRIPNTQVCPHHSTPWRAFADAYFARHPVDVWVGSRGFSGKSFTLALLGLVEAQTLKIDVNLLGGSGEQAKRIHEYMAAFWNAPCAPRQLLLDSPLETKTRLHWGNTITALKASQASVRGPHPVRLLGDEVDTSDLDIIEAALGQTMSKHGVVPHTVLSSTHHVPDGVMTEMLKRARTNGWGVHRFCWRETSNPVDGWLAPADVERKRLEVTARQFEVEYDLGEPSAEGRAIMTEAVDATFLRSLGEYEGKTGEYLEFELPVPGAIYATGADWARTQDFTIIDTIRADVKPARRVAWERRQRQPWPVMIERLNQRLARFPGRACHDGTGIGDVIHAWIVKDAERFIMRGQPRQQLFSSYIAALEARGCVSPYIATCDAEHRYVTTDDLEGEGHPPDSVVAGAMAWRASGLAQQPGWELW